MNVATLHQAAPKLSLLRQLHNKVYGVHHLKGQAIKNVNVLTENFTMGLSQALLEEARETRAGRFLLELLGAVDYAGMQARPVMLRGRKVKAGGFKLTIVVPIDTRLRPGPPPDLTSNGHGVTREG